MVSRIAGIQTLDFLLTPALPQRAAACWDNYSVLYEESLRGSLGGYSSTAA